MKWIEFVLLAVGAVIGAFLRYKLVESPVAVYGLPVNVLVVNVLGSFILGLFSVLSVGLEFGATVHSACGGWVSAVPSPPCPPSHWKPATSPTQTVLALWH